jgi:DNA-binding NarL/FixJ family response regulator
LERIQILLVDMPLMLREMIEQAVAAQPDMNVVAAVAAASALVSAARETKPEFVIFGLEDGEDDFPADCLEVLEEHPRTKALGIRAAAGLAYLYELRPERTAIGEVSPDDIVTTIRTVARQQVG